MAFQEKLEMVLTLDARQAVKGFDQVGNAADRELKKATSRIDKFGAGMRKAGAAMMAMGGVAAVGLWKAGEAASDLAETVNVTGLVFDDAADEMGEFAKAADQSLGMSERAARQATSQFGGLLKNFGFASDVTVQWSKDLTTLAADMASAFDTNPEDAVVALGSAIRGEQEPIRRFNVFLDDASVRLRAVEMGLAATTAEVDINGKAQARLAIIMEQTSDIHGDFQNTADGLANSQRILSSEWENAQATLGEAVLPIMTEVVQAGSGMISTFSELNEKTSGLVGQLSVMGTGFLLIGGGVASAVGHLIKMRDTFKGLGKAADGTLTTMGRMSRVLGGVAGAAAAGAAVWYAYQQAMDNARASGEAWAKTLRDEQMAQLAESGRGLEGIQGKMQGLADAQKNLDDSVANSVAPWDKDQREEMMAAQSTLAEFVVELGMLENQTIALASATGDSSDDIAGWLEEQAAAGTIFADAEIALKAYNAAVLITKGLAPEAAEATADQGQAFVDVASDAADSEQAIKDWGDALRGAFDPMFAAADAEQDVKDAGRDLADAQQEANEAAAAGDWDAHAAAMEDVYSAERDVIDANVDHDVAMRNLHASLEDSSESVDVMTERLDAWVERGDLSAETAEAFRTQLALLAIDANNIEIEIQVGLDTAYAEAKLKALEGRRFGSAGPVDEFMGPVVRSVGGPIPGTAGTPVAVTAHGGEYVLSADVVDAIKRGGSSRGLTAVGASGVSMNFYGYTDEQMVSNVQDASAQMAWSSVSGRVDG